MGWWRGGRLTTEHGGVVLLIVAYALLGVGGELSGLRRPDGSVPWPEAGRLLLVVALTGAQMLPVLWRWRYPQLMMPVAVAGYLAGAVWDAGNDVMIIGVWIAGYVACSRGEGWTVRAAVALGVAAAVLDSTHLPRAVGVTPVVSVLLALLTELGALAAWCFAGRLARARRRRIAEIVARSHRRELDRDVADLRAAAAERARIARDLHDILSHGVTVMVLQAEAAAHVTAASGEPVDPAVLAGIARLGRTALADLRRLLGVLRRGEEADGTEIATSVAPLPRLRDLDELLEQVRAAGLPVRLRQVGATDRLDPSVEVAAYRVVQSGLANVLRHAGSAPTEVTLRAGADGLSVSVVNAAPAGAVPAQATAGTGLIGVRERAGVLGGWATAGPTDSGGFALTAWLPGEEG